MIVARSICLPHSIVRARSLFQALATSWCFSQAQKKLSKSAQKAIWATQIIKTIEQSKPSNKITQPSLRQRIIDLKPASEDYAFDPECKKEVIQLFDGGVVLNPIVFEQDRVTLAQQPKSIEENIEQQNATNMLTANQGKKFIFCPNSLVTKHIFNYMGRNQTNDFFISGGYGISKTVSIILYLHLNNFITKYFYEVSRYKPSSTQRQNQEDKINKIEEMKELQRIRLLRQTAYKYFYWSIDTRQHRMKNIIERIILEQAHQLSQEERQILSGYDDFSIRLQQFYPANIHVRSIVDQIKKLASLIRRSNNEQSKISKMAEDTVKEQAMLTFKQNLIPVMRLRRYLKQFTSLGKQFGVNSSATIEKQLLKTSYEKNESLDLSLQDRQLLTYYRIPYEKSISSREGANEFKQLVWFEIERRLSSFKTTQSIMASIKEKFYKEAEGIPISGFAKFLTVRQQFEKKQLFKLIINDEQEEEFMKQVKSTLQKLESKGLETEKALFKKIFDKSKQKEKLIIENLHQIAELQMLDDDKRYQLFKFHSKDLEVDSKLRGHNLSERLQSKYRNTIEFQENLPYELLEDGMIRLPWTVQQFLRISSDALYPTIAEEYHKRLSQREKTFLRECGGAKGMRFQSQLIKCLIKGSRAKIQVFTQADAKGNLLSNIETTNIEHVTTFLHFNKSEPNKRITDHNFKQLLEISRKHPNSACVAIPHYIDQQGNLAFSDKSKAIDFIFCQYDSEKVFHISTYDATVSKYVNSKYASHPIFYQEDILQNMRKFNIPADQFKFRHVILCPKGACKPMEVKANGKYILQYADSLDLTIKDCPDEEAKDALEQIQRLTRIYLNNRARK